MVNGVTGLCGMGNRSVAIGNELMELGLMDSHGYVMGQWLAYDGNGEMRLCALL